MKSFSKFLKEGVGTSDQQIAVDNGINPSEIQNPKVLRALNAYVGAIANMEFMLPEQALTKLRSALDRVGYSFGAIPEMTEQSGSFDLPLVRFGGRFGKDTDTPHDEVIIRHYNNPQCEGEKEFEDDLKRFKYIKRLLRKNYDTGILKERLLLNHLIVLTNVFGTTACVTLLLYKIQEEYWPVLKEKTSYLT